MRMRNDEDPKIGARVLSQQTIQACLSCLERAHELSGITRPHRAQVKDFRNARDSAVGLTSPILKECACDSEIAEEVAHALAQSVAFKFQSEIPQQRARIAESVGLDGDEHHFTGLGVFRQGNSLAFVLQWPARRGAVLHVCAVYINVAGWPQIQYQAYFSALRSRSVKDWRDYNPVPVPADLVLARK